MEGMLPSVCATTAVESFFHHRPLAFDTHRLSHAHTARLDVFSCAGSGQHAVTTNSTERDVGRDMIRRCARWLQPHVGRPEWSDAGLVQ